MLWVLIRSDPNEYPQRKFLWRSVDNIPIIIIKYPPDLFLCTYMVDVIDKFESWPFIDFLLQELHPILVLK